MKHFIFLIMLLLPLSGWSQIKKFEDHYEDGTLLVSGFKDKKTGKREGHWIVYAQDGGRIEECDYKNGLEEGLLIEYNAYNKVSAITEYHQGKKEGKYISYHTPLYNTEKEWIESTATYRNDKLEGMQYKYDEDGNIIQRSRMSKGQMLTDTIIRKNDIAYAHIEYSEARPEGLYVIDKVISLKKNDPYDENNASTGNRHSTTATERKRYSSIRNNRSAVSRRQTVSARPQAAKPKQKTEVPKHKPRMHVDANGTIVYD